jgi:hypothetical protein
LGLTCCATPIGRFLDQFDRSRKSLDDAVRGPAAEALLRAYYVALLAAQQESVAAVIAGLGG